LNPKLLIVDDERGIVDMIQSYFQTQYDILTAYSGQEASGVRSMKIQTEKFL